MIIAFFIFSYLAVEFGAVTTDVNAATYIESLHKYAEKGYMLLILSIPIFLVVYSDEVSSHSMQCIVGRGVSRRKILWAKLIDCFVLTGIIFAVYMTLQYFLAQSNPNVRFSANQTKVYIAYALICVLKIVAAASFSMMVMFITNSTAIGVFCVILFTTISPNIMSLLYVKGITVMNFSYDMILLRGMNNLAAGVPAWELIPWSAVYIFGAWLITYLFFRRKEFDF